MSNAYNDAAVPGNSFVNDIKRGGIAAATTIIASAVFESFTPNRPGKTSNRPDIYGGPNGFLLTAEQETGSGVFQIPTATSKTPRVGDWFTRILDRDPAPALTEHWVFTSMSDPQEMGSYAKCSFSAQLAHSPTA